MTDEKHREEFSDQPPYQDVSEVDSSALRQALCKLKLLGDDPFLSMQTFNLSLVDQFLMDLESQLHQKHIAEERTPIQEAAFLSAQSQMWIFAAYELMRTWRQRAKDMIKWAESGGLEQKLAALEKEDGYQHFGRQIRADQIRVILADSNKVSAINRDLMRTNLLFPRLEAIRISLAKHEVKGKENSVSLIPGGHGYINAWCGALDYMIDNGGGSIFTINRRDIADEIRLLVADDYLPSDDHIASFKRFMSRAC